MVIVKAACEVETADGFTVVAAVFAAIVAAVVAAVFAAVVAAVVVFGTVVAAANAGWVMKQLAVIPTSADR
ncbi:MAG: hypothetical protein HGA22_03575 [Clostridiales bacterium]|nr:hypothetical protein [Clostridiales bacterium]